MKHYSALVVLILLFCESNAGQILEKKPEIYSLHVVSDIKYRFSTTQVTSRVKNSDETPREAIFDVTLPNEAFITNLTLDIDGKIIVGEIKEKKAAREQYEAAKQRGESAGYIGTKHRETNKFNLAITVAPLSKVSFNLTYQELLRRKHGHYEQVIYIDPGQPVQDMHVTVAILETREITDLVVPPLRNDIDVDLTGTSELSSVIIQQPAANKAYVKYFPSIEEQMETSINGISGQFVVKYDVDREMDAGDLMVVNGYFVHFFAPEGFTPIPKDVLFVLDKSGSMHGTKIVQLKEAMLSILDELNEGDRLNIMTFSSSTSFWRPEMVEITGPKIIEEAVQHVQSISPGGWTNIEGAVTMGLAALAGRDKDSVAVRSPVLVFLTDGEATRGITNKELILSSVKDSNVEEIPIFSLAFGEGADYDLVKKLSAQNLGFARKIYEASDADKQISGFYKEISVTLLNNVTFTYLDAPISNVTETEFPNYFEGSEVIVAGRMITVDVQDNGLVLRSEIQANSVEGIRVLRADAEMEESGFHYNLTGIGDYEKITEKVWAYLTIKGLLKKAMATENETLKEGYNKRVLELSLKYGFVTPLTSMVVTKPDVEEEEEEVDVLDEDDYDEPPIAPKLYGRGSRPIPGLRRGFMTNGHNFRRRTMARPMMHAQIANSPPVASSYNSLMPDLPRRSFDRRHGPAMYHDAEPGRIGSKLGGKKANKKSRMRARKDKQRQDRRREKQRRKQQRGLTDFPLKMKSSGIDETQCYSLFSSKQYQRASVDSYLIYSDNSSETIITAAMAMRRVNKWRTIAEIKTVTIETKNYTEIIARSDLQNRSIIKREITGFDMYVLPSVYAEGLSVFFDITTEDKMASGEGIIARLLSKKMKLKKTLPLKKGRKKGRRGKQPTIRGVFKIKGEKKFLVALATLTGQGVPIVGTTCWNLEKKESRFFEMDDFMITSH